MKYLTYPLILIWRVWFYFLVIFTILPVFPVLVILIAKENRYPVFCRIANAWGKTMLFLMGFWTEVTYEEKLEPGKSYMLSANHTSMLDIMVMFAIMKGNPFVFVGKAELAKIPVFGYIFKKTSILVDRSSVSSRKSVFDEANRRIELGRSICIFPEGEVPKDESLVLTSFKNGAFILAIEHNIPIVPMSFYDNKKHFSYTFFSGKPGKLRVKIHKPISTTGMQLNEDKNKLKKQVYDLIYTDLVKNT